MTNKKPSRSIICAVLLICITIFSGLSTFAQENSPSDSAVLNTLGNKKYLEEAVIKLMEEGKLSREKVEKILEYKKKRESELSKLTKDQKIGSKDQRKKGSLLRDLIHDGIITEAEAQTIKSKLKEMKEARLDGGLQGLVDQGVLSGKDIDNIRDYMVKVREERKAQIEKLRTMTPEERKVYFEKSKKERKDIITRMVEDKVITEKQGEEIKKAIPELSKPRFKKSN
jgi:superfamily II DNA helicase RecQ